MKRLARPLSKIKDLAGVSVPLKSGKLTPQERAFTQSYASTGDGAYAKTVAKLRSNSAASQTLARPAVQAEIRRIQEARLNNEVLPAAVDLLHRVITDDRAADRVRVTAAKIVLDRTLGATDASGADRDPSEMTPDEIQVAIDRLRREAADRAKPVIDHEQNPGKPGVFE